MTAKLKLSREAVLPENAACDHCVEMLTAELGHQPGIEQVHRDAADHFCLHYDAARWDEPTLARTVRLAGADLQHRFQRRHWEISALDCADCVATVERGLQGIPGVLNCQVNLATGMVAVEWDQGQVSEHWVRATLREIGHAVVEPRPEIAPTESADWRTRWAARARRFEYLSIALSGLAFAGGL
ncbi:MAG TPA: hypothetical protein DEP84_05025, partial [Chloroflexi bacterium]|nr:hypothetical protein [Chloroflexota bacterium]